MSAWYVPKLITKLGGRGSIALSMALLSAGMVFSPLVPWLALAVLIYGAMGSARGISGVAMNTSLMEQVPPRFMGRVQNTFYFFGTFLQIVLGFLVGAAASRISLSAGYSIIGVVYAIAFASACWPVKTQHVVASAAD